MAGDAGRASLIRYCGATRRLTTSRPPGKNRLHLTPEERFRSWIDAQGCGIRPAEFSRAPQSARRRIIMGGSAAFGNAAIRLEAFVVKACAYAYGSYNRIFHFFGAYWSPEYAEAPFLFRDKPTPPEGPSLF